MSTTTILHLNDDCMIEVFKHLNLHDLCSVADVCFRFRQNAQAQFSYSEFKYLGFRNDFIHSSETAKQKLLGTSQVLRNFGAFARSIYNVNGYCFRNCRSEYHIRTFELISGHCSASLIELHLVKCNITDAIAIIMRPVLANLQKLTLREGSFSHLFLNMLPLWAPKLRELKFIRMCGQSATDEVIRFDGLQQSYPKLRMLSFSNVDYVRNKDIDGFLIRNSHLKKIELVVCRNVDDHILQSIAEHVPQLETIRFDQCCPNNDCNVQYFARLSCLCSLEISNLSRDSASYAIAIVCKIGTAGIPIRHVTLSNIEFSGGNVHFVDAISKLKHLGTLRIDKFAGLAAAEIRQICKSLRELTEIYLIGNEFTLTADNLMELIRYSENLKSLYFLKQRFMIDAERNHIDADTYAKIVRILEERRERSHLLLCLSSPTLHTANIPADFIRKHNHLLTLVMR